MELFEAIQKRHSYRGAFTEQPIPRADLERIVQAGIQAPSGCNAQTTSFVIVDEPERRAAIHGVLDKETVRTAQAVILCVVDPQPVYKGMAFPLEDCAAAVENMLLAIAALGYATVWLDGFLRVEGRAEALGTLIGIPEGRRVQVVLPLGVPAEAGTQREKKPFAERAWYNQWGRAAD